jgi:hypothetical protein
VKTIKSLFISWREFETATDVMVMTETKLREAGFRISSGAPATLTLRIEPPFSWSNEQYGRLFQQQQEE